MLSGGRRAAAILLPAAAVFLGWSAAAYALERATVEKLAFGESDERIAAIGALVTEGDPQALDVLKALAEGEMQTAGKRVLIVRGGKAIDAITREPVTPVPSDAEDVVANNRLRAAIGDALALLKLLSPERAERLASANALAGDADPSMLPLVQKALAKEGDREVRGLLQMIAAGMQLKTGSRDTRIAAIRTLGRSSSPSSKTMLLELANDPDADVRREARVSLEAVEKRLALGEWLGLAFAGISLASVLLLAALGLAIIYGLMGVINMAHGELIMIGAYTTYVVQSWLRGSVWFDWYLALAIPAAFAVSGLIGMALERSVIRWLYGRPLETLLATWGISLILIQAVRTLFGAQNVQVENPAFMSGGVQVLSNVVLPWSRIYIVLFVACVLAAMWLLLARTRLGLFIRGVTQNRAMASCVGVPTSRIDTWAFGLGAGIAGIAGCALSQLGNVGPDLGQAYIVDSFLVVVFGGVGQLAGTVYAALVLGVANKLLESWSGAVLAKIAVLVFIIFFIQRRPQGLFALRGRVAD